MLKHIFIGTMTGGLSLLFAVTAYASSPPEDSNAKGQKVVYMLKDGKSHLLNGDPQNEQLKGKELEVLPLLLNQGWRISRVEMTASAAVNPDQVLAIVVLDK